MLALSGIADDLPVLGYLDEPGTLSLPNHTNASHFFGFCLQVFRQAGSLRLVDCLAMENKRKVSFPRINNALPSLSLVNI